MRERLHGLISLHKLVLICIIGILISLNSFAQNSEKALKFLEKGDLLFYEKDYESALKSYHKAFSKDSKNSYCAEKIAYSYLYLNEITNSLRWFKKTEQIYGSFVPDFAVRYALALMEAGEYDLARDKFQEYNDFFESDNPLVYKYLLSIENKDKYFDDSTYFDLMNTILSSKQADFSAQYYDNHLYYLNSSNEETGEAPTYRRTNLLSAEVKSESEIEPIGYIKGFKQYTHKILSLSIAEDAKEIYGTYISDSEDPLRIYNLLKGSILSNDEISKMEEVKVEGFDLNILHVTVNNSGKVIYFASDAPGGFGGFDLYKATDYDGNFKNVTNLGPVINSSEDEIFPYLFNDSILYFSSKGHGGLGGYDLFIMNLEDEKNEPRNLGYPINTNSDEFTLSFYSDFIGFISSNRSNGVGMEDIYQFTINNLEYKGLIADEETGENLKQVDVSVNFKNGKTEQLKLADNGTLTFDILPGDEFEIEVRKEGYEDRTFHVDSKEWNLTGTYSFNAGTLPLKAEEISEPIAMNTSESDEKGETKQPIIPTNVSKGTTIVENAVKREKPTVQSSSYHYENVDHGVDFFVQIGASKVDVSIKTLQRKYTGEREIGSFKYGAWNIYHIGSFSSYYKAKDIVKSCGVRDAFVSAYKDGKRLKLMDGIKMAHIPKDDNIQHLNLKPDKDAIKKEIIYFSFDGVVLTNKEMEKIYEFVDMLRNNPNYYLELIGYSDRQGSALYNKAISYQRATNIQQLFLIEGVDQKQLEVYGFGEGAAGTSGGNQRRVEIILKKR